MLTKIKISFLAIGVPALIAVGCKKEDPKQNIIFILADDLGYSQLGCYGSNYYQTPISINWPKKACVLPMLMQHVRFLPQPGLVL